MQNHGLNDSIAKSSSKYPQSLKDSTSKRLDGKKCDNLTYGICNFPSENLYIIGYMLVRIENKLQKTVFHNQLPSAGNEWN